MSRIKFGWSRKEISLDEPISIPGQHHMRISEGILDPLYATALCVDGGTENGLMIFCSLDITNMRNGFMDIALEKIAKRKPEIPVNCVIMNATHTHTSCHMNRQPEKSLDGIAIYPMEKWRDFATDRVADAVIEAYETRAEGGMAYGYSFAVVAHSRRAVYLKDQSLGVAPGSSSNGFAVMYGNTNKEDFGGYETGADHFVNLMYTFDASDKLTGIVINVPCPSQVTEMYNSLSADYWADVRERVEAKYGKDVYVLTQCAAAGDLSPRILHYKKAQVRRMALKYDMPYDLKKLKDARSIDYYNKSMSERKDIADRIMYAVDEVYDWAKKDIQTDVKVEHEYTVLDLHRRMVTDDEYEYAKQAIKNVKPEIPENATAEEERIAMNRYNNVIARNERVLERYENQNPADVTPMRMHVARIGDIAFATNRFELYMDYMHRMQARSPFLQTFVVQLAGEENGSYLPTEKAQANKGYGSSVYESQISEVGGEQIVEKTLEILNRMAAED